MLKRKEQEDILKRLNKIKGQLEGLKKMVEEPRYCIDIMEQISAIRGALKSIALIVLESHIKTCVKDALKDRKNEEVKINEVIREIKKFL